MNKPRRNPVIIVLILFMVLGTLSVPAIAAASGTHTPVTGVTVGVSGATDNSMSGGAITVTAKGSKGVLGFGASSKTTTITITNSSGGTADISFDWTATSVYELIIDGAKKTETTGSFSKTFSGTEKITITITTEKNNTVNKLVMSNFVVIAAAASSKVTIDYVSEQGSVTAGGSAVTSGTTQDVSSDVGILLKATPSSGYTFVGWVDSESKLHSKVAEFTLFPTTEAITLKPIFAKNDGTSKAWFSVNGQYMFDDLNAANAKANKNGTIILMHSGTLHEGEYTIDSGVTLLIPFDDVGTLCQTQPVFDGTIGANILVDPSSANAWVKPTAFRTLTMSSGTEIIVNGALSVSGKMCGYQVSNGCPTGPLGFISMASGSNITINGGGNLYAWGYIIGSGSVTVESGGTVYESFQLKDWRGGTVASDMIGNDQKVFIVSQYYVQNVEVPMTLKSGATEYGYTGLVASRKYADALVPFIGGSGMFTLSDASGSITKDYLEDLDRILITVDGSLNMKNLSLNVDGGSLSYNMDSSKYVLPLSNHYTVNIVRGTLDISQDMCLLPGSEIIIDSGAQVTLGTGVNLYVYDLDEWNGKLFVYSSRDYTPLAYVGAKKGAPVKRTLTDAKIVINGTFDASKGYVYCTSHGAIITSEGNGKFISGTSGTSTTTYQYVQSGDGFTAVPIFPAKLYNPDVQGGTVGTFTETYLTSEVTTFKYCNTCKRWMQGETHTCGIEYATNVELGNNLNLYFAFYKDGVTDWKDYSIKIYQGNKLVKTVVYNENPWATTTISEKQYAYVVFDELLASEMCDTFCITLYNGDTVVNSWTDSLRNYATRLYYKNTDRQNLPAVIAAMLNYGAACQVEKDQYTNNLANQLMPVDKQQTYVKATAPAVNDLTDTFGVNAHNLTIDSNIKFYIRLNGVSVGDSVQVYFTGHKGNPEGTPDNPDSYTVLEDYKIEITALVVADFEQKIYITNGSATVSTSISTYLAAMQNDGVNDVFDAFREFASAAQTYLHDREV